MVTAILLNYNQSEYTLNCVNSLLKSENCEFKVLIIDNGSKPNEYENLCAFNDEKVSIHRIENNCGYVGGVNYGLKIAQQQHPDYFLIMNNDTIIDKNAISELVTTAIKYNNKCIVSGKVYNMDEPDTLQYIGQWCRNHEKLDYPPYVKNMREKDIGQFDNEIEMDILDDIFWLLPANVFIDIGYYSNYFFLYGEQIDYALRARKTGVRLIYTPQARIWHKGALSTSQGDSNSPKIVFWRAKSYLVLSYLHMHFYKFLVIFFIQAFNLFIRIPKLLTRKRKLFQAQLYAFLIFTFWLFNKKPDKGYNPLANMKIDS